MGAAVVVGKGHLSFIRLRNSVYICGLAGNSGRCLGDGKLGGMPSVLRDMRFKDLKGLCRNFKVRGSVKNIRFFRPSCAGGPMALETYNVAAILGPGMGSARIYYLFCSFVSCLTCYSLRKSTRLHLPCRNAYVVVSRIGGFVRVMISDSSCSRICIFFPGAMINRAVTLALGRHGRGGIGGFDVFCGNCEGLDSFIGSGRVSSSCIFWKCRRHFCYCSRVRLYGDRRSIYSYPLLQSRTCLRK